MKQKVMVFFFHSSNYFCLEMLIISSSCELSQEVNFKFQNFKVCTCWYQASKDFQLNSLVLIKFSLKSLIYKCINIPSQIIVYVQLLSNTSLEKLLANFINLVKSLVCQQPLFQNYFLYKFLEQVLPTLISFFLQFLNFFNHFFLNRLHVYMYQCLL